MPAQLVPLSHEGMEPVLLDRPILLLGRHAECDIHLNSRKISRKHCCIAIVGGKLIIRDLGSVNGVQINNQRVIEGAFQVGDEVTIGNFRFAVRDTENGKPPVSSAVGSSRPPVGKIVHGDEDDGDLDSCDEPVALQEPPPPAPNRDIAAPDAGPPNPNPPNPSPSDLKPPAKTARPPKLAPLSVPDHRFMPGNELKLDELQKPLPPAEDV